MQTLWARRVPDNTSVFEECYMPDCLQMKAFASSMDNEPAWMVIAMALESKNAIERRDLRHGAILGGFVKCGAPLRTFCRRDYAQSVSKCVRRELMTCHHAFIQEHIYKTTAVVLGVVPQVQLLHPS